MKLNWQLTVVIVAGIGALVAMVYFLTSAGWSEGGVAGLVTGIFTALGSLALVIRNQSKQGEKIDTIVEQTNGRSGDELQEIADRAAVKVIEAYRNGRLR